MRKSIQSIGQVGLFLVRIVLSLRFSREQLADIARQIYSVGARSLPIIAVGGLFVGLVISLQGYRALETIGAGSALGTAVGIPLYRELGPVLAAILFCGRAGSSIAAERRGEDRDDQIAGGHAGHDDRHHAEGPIDARDVGILRRQPEPARHRSCDNGRAPSRMRSVTPVAAMRCRHVKVPAVSIC